MRLPVKVTDESSTEGKLYRVCEAMRLRVLRLRGLLSLNCLWAPAEDMPLRHRCLGSRS